MKAIKDTMTPSDHRTSRKTHKDTLVMTRKPTSFDLSSLKRGQKATEITHLIMSPD